MSKGEIMLAVSRTAYGPNLLSRLLAARTLQQIEECAKSAWILNGEGLVGDDEMQYLAPVIEHQRKAISAGTPPPRATGRTRHSRPAIPVQKRAKSWLRRRTLAKDCIIPTCLAQAFTISKLAVLAVIARAVLDRGQSNMSLPELAARAGVGCTTARYAIRDAVRMGLISVSENRINRFWNRPNTIRIVCGRWLRWLEARATYGAKQKSADRPTPGFFGTSLRNLIPTIDIIRFSVRSTVHQKLAGRAIPLCWRGDAGFCGGRKTFS
jgi:hypothetical protein